MSESPLTREEPAISSFDAFRKQFPLLQDVAYFQTGSLAPLADPVRDAAVHAFEAEGTSALAGWEAYAEFQHEAEACRARLAAFLGVRASELAWTASTTTALRHAIDSFAWRPGYSLVTTNREHISTRKLQEGLRQRHGVETKVVEAGEGDDRLLSELEDSLTGPRAARLLLISQISCQDGRRLPVAEAVRLAHSHEAPVLVDAAQSLGQLPVDVGTLGCDLLVGSAHKWLLGPAGLGFLHVAPDGLVPFDAPFAMAPRDHSGSESPPIAIGIELGTAGISARAGLAAALDLIDSIGLSTIERYVAESTDRLVDELAALPKVRVLSPDDSTLRSGMVSFAVEGCDHAGLMAITSALWQEDKIMAKVQVEHPSIRISFAAFNNASDIDRLIHALRLALDGYTP